MSRRAPKSLFVLFSLFVANSRHQKNRCILVPFLFDFARPFPAFHLASLCSPSQSPLPFLPFTLPFFLSAEGVLGILALATPWLSIQRQNASLRGSHDGWLNAFCSRPEGFFVFPLTAECLLFINERLSQSRRAAICSLVKGWRLSMSRPLAARMGFMYAGTSWWLSWGAIESSEKLCISQRSLMV